MHSPESPSSAIARLAEENKPYALVRRQGDDEALLLEGELVACERVGDIPVEMGTTDSDTFDTVSMIPYAQIRERGFEALQGTEAIRCLRITKQTRINIRELLTTLPVIPLILNGEPEFHRTDEEYAEDVATVQKEVIGKGEASNIVLSRIMHARIENMSKTVPLSVFRSLLQREFGSYMDFLFHDGERTIIAASPERQFSVRKDIVTMNPISGTLRKTDSLTKEQLLAFLRDQKETHELFMVADEELKQIARTCEKGGEIRGPFLKEMSKVIHTEFELVGRTTRRPLEVFPYSMHAPTVIGGPMERCASLLPTYEKEPRRYYGGSFLLTGRDADGYPMLDSAIAIRMMEIAPDGAVRFQAGSSIVRDSVPPEEAKESRAKVGGPLQAILRGDAVAAAPLLPALLADPEVQAALRERMHYASTFLSENQEGKNHESAALRGKRITIVDNEDDFCHVMGHMIRAMGGDVRIVKYSEFDPVGHGADLVIVGPGPGDPNNDADPKMRKNAFLIEALKRQQCPLLAVCLGHQLLSKSLGMTVQSMQVPAQGMHKEIDLFGETQSLGFYNTFAAKAAHVPGVRIAADAQTGDVHALRGEKFSGFQFHPESVLSKNGFEVLRGELETLLR